MKTIKSIILLLALLLLLSACIPEDLLGGAPAFIPESTPEPTPDVGVAHWASRGLANHSTGQSCTLG